MVCAIFSYDIIYYSLPSFHAEIHIEVGHRNSLGIEKSLKQQIIFQRVNSSYPDAVSTQAACTRTSAAPYGYPVSLGVIYKIPDYKIIVCITHFRDNIKLVGKSLLCLVCRVFIALVKSLFAHITQELFIVINAVDMKIRQLCLSELELHIAALGYLHGVFYRLGIIRKQLSHLIAAFYIELFCRELQLVRVIERCRRRYADKHPLRLGIFPAQIMRIVRRSERYARFLRQSCQKWYYAFLIVNAVILYFEIIIIAAEDLGVTLSCLLCAVVVAKKQLSRYLSRKAGRQADKSAAVFSQKFLVNSRLCIKALGI